jgi:hypothetical protein
MNTALVITLITVLAVLLIVVIALACSFGYGAYHPRIRITNSIQRRGTTALGNYVSSVLRDHNIPHSAACGTAIGVARHGRIMSFDDDVDFVALHTDMDKIRSIVEADPHLHFNESIFGIQINSPHTFGGMHVDIFELCELDEHPHVLAYNEPSRKKWPGEYMLKSEFEDTRIARFAPPSVAYEDAPLTDNPNATDIDAYVYLNDSDLSKRCSSGVNVSVALHQYLLRTYGPTWSDIAVVEQPHRDKGNIFGAVPRLWKEVVKKRMFQPKPPPIPPPPNSHA